MREKGVYIQIKNKEAPQCELIFQEPLIISK